MKIKHTYSKKDLLKANIDASPGKWTNKVSIFDTEKYLKIINNYESVLVARKEKGIKAIGPIACIAVRNGREVDNFRICLNFPNIKNVIKIFEFKRTGFRTLFFSFLDKFYRSKLNNIKSNSVVGLDINPKSKRQDISIGSFDEMPNEWEGIFSVLYFNSLDHAYDPKVTANEILRCMKKGGYVIIAFPGNQEPGKIDPVGLINLDDIKKLFGNEIIYYQKEGSRWFYTEYIIRV